MKQNINDTIKFKINTKRKLSEINCTTPMKKKPKIMKYSDNITSDIDVVKKLFNKYKNARNKYEIINITPASVHNDIVKEYKKCKIKPECKEMKELFGWHGSSLDNIKQICKTGFNPKLCKTHEHGKGTYFDIRVDKACDFSLKNKDGNRYVLLCKILGCKCVEGNKTFNGNEHACFVNYKPPKRTTIYCITNKNHSIPWYIVMFSQKNQK